MKKFVCIVCRKKFEGDLRTDIFNNAFCADKCLIRWQSEKIKPKKEKLKCQK